jgi:hypothetical protein
MSVAIMDTQRYTPGGAAVLEDQYYAISTPKLLGATYKVKAPTGGTVALTYMVGPFTSEVTKGAAYAVAAPTDTTRTAQYTVTAQAEVAEPTTYTVRITPAAPTLGAEYRVAVSREVNPDWSGGWEPPDGWEGACISTYAVRLTLETTKGLQYVVQGQQTIEVQRAATYTVAAPGGLTKGATYLVKAQGALAIPAAYEVEVPGAVIKSAGYRVRATPGAEALPAEYAVAAVAAVEIARGATYSVRAQPAVTREARYVLVGESINPDVTIRVRGQAFDVWVRPEAHTLLVMR